MKISNLLTSELIRLDLESETKEDVLQELVDLLSEAGKVTSSQDFYQTILEREEEGSTGVGNGVAIPHGQSDVVVEPALVFAKSETGIEFNSRDGEPTKIFFMIAVPESGSSDHLKVLSNLSRKLMHDDFRQELLAAETKQQVLAAVEDQE